MQGDRSHRLAPILFSLALFAFAYFHQGGGWNQNGRFAMVRALVERGTFSIDSYLIYTQDDTSGTVLRRVPIQNGEFVDHHQKNVLVWRDSEGRPFPVNGSKLDQGNV